MSPVQARDEIQADGRPTRIEVLNQQRNVNRAQDSIEIAEKIALGKRHQSRDGYRNCIYSGPLSIKRGISGLLSRKCVHLPDYGEASGSLRHCFRYGAATLVFC